jgi:hypothetical protein
LYRAAPAPHTAHEGPHVFYADGPHYAWLKRRGCTAGLGLPGPLDLTRAGFRSDDGIRRLPPARMLRALSHPWTRAPVDLDFHTWAAERWRERTAAQLAHAIGVVTYEADTAGLSAAFVRDLVQRVLQPKRRLRAGSW